MAEEQELDRRDEGDQISTIPDGIERFNYSISTRDIIEYFSHEQDVVNRYEESRKWYYWLEGKPSLFLVIAYLSSILAAVVFTSFADLSEEQQNTIFGGMIVILILVATILWVLKKIVENRAKKEDISADEAVYYELSQAIQNYREDRFGDTKENLKNARILLRDGNAHPFDSDFSSELKEYLEAVEDNDSEKFVSNTFPVIADRLLKYLSIIKESKSEELYRKEDSKADSYSTLRGIIQSYFADLHEHRIVRIVFPFVLAIPLIIAIYYFVDKTLAQFTFLAYIAIVQIYYNFRSSE